MKNPFEFCNDCLLVNNCCSKVKKGGRIEPPFLTSQDIQNISEYIKEPLESFCENRDGSNDKMIFLKSNGGEKCIFLDEEMKCKVYDVRPLDCRLFPLDVIKEENDYYWIIYTRFCFSNKINIPDLLEFANGVLPQLAPYLDDYATIDLPGMDEEEYTILGKIDIDS